MCGAAQVAKGEESPQGTGLRRLKETQAASKSFRLEAAFKGHCESKDVILASSFASVKSESPEVN